MVRPAAWSSAMPRLKASQLYWRGSVLAWINVVLLISSVSLSIQLLAGTIRSHRRDAAGSSDRVLVYNREEERILPVRLVTSGKAEVSFSDSDPSVPEPGQSIGVNQNSRVFCRVGPICFDSSDYNRVHDFSKAAEDPRPPHCKVMSAGGVHLVEESGRLLSDSQLCEKVRDAAFQSLFKKWSKEKDRTWMRSHRSQIHWHRTGIVVPSFKYIENVFHMSRMYTFVLHVLWNAERYGLPPDMPLHFRTSLITQGRWAVGLTNAVMAKGQEIYSLRQSAKKTHCFEEAVVLGLEGRFDALQFINDTDVVSRKEMEEDSHIPGIPLEAIQLREVVKSALDLPSLTDSPSPVYGKPEIQLPVPPRKIVIMDRSASAKRQFDHQTRASIMSILEKVAAESDFNFEIYTFDNIAFRPQVDMMHSVGIMLGIHGANLHNCIFSPPGAALIEIFPYMYTRFYYLGGSNSGLRYSFHETRSGIEHDCSDIPESRKLECGLRYRSQDVTLNSQELEIVQAKLRRAVTYINALHSMGPTITFELKDSTYHMKDSARLRKLMKRSKV